MVNQAQRTEATIAAGLMLSATYPAGTEAIHRVASVLAAVLTMSGSLALVVSLAAVMFACKPSTT